jgi:hypothetical protein
MKLKFIFCLLIVLSFVTADTLPELVPLTPEKLPPTLNDPPETYSGQVIIKYIQNYKEAAFDEDLIPPDESVLTVDVLGTIYPVYENNYENNPVFTGIYLFKEGQISWNYNAKKFTMNPPCEYLITSVGAGNIDIAHTDKIGSDSKIVTEIDGEYMIDINNDERIYLTAEGLPVIINCNSEGCTGYDNAMSPVQTTSKLLSGSVTYCGEGNAQTNDVPPAINIRLENLKLNGNILSGEDHLQPENSITEMISYTIDLPAVKQSSNSQDEPAISNNNPDKQGLLDIIKNWLNNLFK